MMNYKYVVTLIVIAVVISVGIGYVATYKPGEDGGEDNEAEFTIYFVLPTVEDPFWITVREGAEAAGEMLPIEFHLVSPSVSWTPDVYVDLVNSIAVLSPDAMIITPHVYTSLVDPVNEAMDKGILVWYSDVHDVLHESNLPDLAFVGGDDYRGGIMVAQELMKRAGLSTGDTVLICNHIPGASGQVLRSKGVHETCQSEGINVEELDTGTDVSAGAEIIKAYLMAHPEIDASVSLGTLSCEEWNLAITDLGVTDIPAASFDVALVHLEMIREGTLMFTVDRAPFMEGFLPVVFCYHWLEFKMPLPHNIDTTTGYVDASNVDDVEEFIEWQYKVD